METRDILIVDDDINCRLLFRLLLESEGFDVATAPDGINALETLENRDFSMVVTDFNMPAMSGLELAVKAQEKHLGIQVVMVTGTDTPDIAEAAAAAGVSRIFPKPLNSKAFVAAIRSSLCHRSIQESQEVECKP